MNSLRSNLVIFVIFLVSAAIIGRLFYIQVMSSQYWRALAQGQQKFFMDSEGERGEIFFQGRTLPIATSKKYSFVYISPNEIPEEEKENVSKALSETLSLDYETLAERLKRDSFYEVIKNRLSVKEYDDLKALNSPNIEFGEKTIRDYPYGEFASHILGFVNEDGEGQYGIEGYWDNELRGGKEFLECEKWLWGCSFSNQKSQSNGSDLYLTIDYNIQYRAEKLLESAFDQLDIEGGTIIVMEPFSGKLLALAEYPNFDPNRYFAEKDFKVFQTDAIQKFFEPGSIFKPITMAAALEEKKVTPDTTYIDRGFVTIGIHTIYNYDKVVWGKQTMTQVLENSINTGAVFAESQLGNTKFSEYIEKFGILEKTGVDLGNEYFSQNKEFKNGYEINFATASFGQGIEMTPLQIVRASAAIANGGKLVRPYIVEKSEKNNKINETQPQIQNPSVISQKTASQLTAMLVSSVESGYAKRAKISGYYIAGKTGTAQIPFTRLGIDKAGYSDKTWQSFIGFAPAFNPKFLILVKLDNPKVKAASISTTLIAHDLIQYIINYYQIPRIMKDRKIFLIFIPFLATFLLVGYFVFMIPNKAPKSNKASESLEPKPKITITTTLETPLDFQDYPLSCEAASLKMALIYKGIYLSEDEIIKEMGSDHSPREANIWADPQEVFVGDINGKMCVTGYGVYWERVAKAANRWVKAEAFSNWKMDDLTREINLGNPIIVWGSIPGSLTDCSWHTPEGKYIKAYKETHVRLLIGFVDSPENPSKIILNDPLKGRISWETGFFLENWAVFGNSGVVIR